MARYSELQKPVIFLPGLSCKMQESNFEHRRWATLPPTIIVLDMIRFLFFHTWSISSNMFLAKMRSIDFPHSFNHWWWIAMCCWYRSKLSASDIFSSKEQEALWGPIIVRPKKNFALFNVEGTWGCVRMKGESHSEKTTQDLMLWLELINLFSIKYISSRSQHVTNKRRKKAAQWKRRLSIHRFALTTELLNTLYPVWETKFVNSVETAMI